jgi:hypothetical protein
MKKILIACIGLVCLVSCGIESKQTSDFYNIIYDNGQTIIEYNDVTNVEIFGNKITFVTCYNTIVVLDKRFIKVIPIDID